MKYTVKVGIIGGSGLDNPDFLHDRTERRVETPYGSPSDAIIEGVLDGVPCALLARHGRQHSIAPSLVNYRANIWALKEVGCTHIVATTACGSLREDYTPGSIVILDNFIDRTTQRKLTLFDPINEAMKGVCHVPMEPAFCMTTRAVVIDSAKSANINVISKGTCVTIEGPRFSSKAESSMFRMWNADVVNMTTVPEVTLAKEAGICYASIAMITDFDCWRSDGSVVNVSDVLKTFHVNVGKVTALLHVVVKQIHQREWDDVIDDLQNTVKGGTM